MTAKGQKGFCMKSASGVDCGVGFDKKCTIFVTFASMNKHARVFADFVLQYNLVACDIGWKVDYVGGHVSSLLGVYFFLR